MIFFSFSQFPLYPLKLSFAACGGIGFLSLYPRPPRLRESDGRQVGRTKGQQQKSLNPLA